MKKVNKIQEFMSNQGSVNCATFGKNAGHLIATGGNDRKVNIWKIGCPKIVAQLHGHTSTVDSVTFDSEGETVVSGSSGGTIKVWDVNSERMQKSFNSGHKTNVTCLDYHPFGNFFCSGSTDTHVKIWDLRKKGHLQLYKGHSKSVQTVKFSPDGRWVVSGGGDGFVKLWDLTAGKQMEDFTKHQAEVTSLDFHPTEFLLAVGSADRTITFWDMDKFKILSQTQLDSKAVRCIRFTPDGSALCGATSETLKVWAWEPATCHDSVDVHWQSVSDLHVSERTGELFGVSFVDSFVSVWMVRLQKLHPFSDCSAPEPSSSTVADVRGQVYTVSPETKAKRLHDAALQQEEIQKRFGLTEAHRIIGEQEKQLQEQARRQQQQALQLQKLQKAELAPKQVVHQAPEKLLPKPSKKPEVLVDDILSDHQGMTQMLSQRLTNLKVLKSLWQQDKKGALLHVLQLNDSSISVDFLKQIVKSRDRDLNLDLCVGILPVTRQVLHAVFEPYLNVGLEAVATLWHAFGDLIGKTLAQKSAVVDVTLEERKDKCRIARDLFADVQVLIAPLQERRDDVGHRSRILWKELPCE
eukprot:NODE_775_length_1911_cov_70.657358_g717_i0.p1 GENE.NODE_775_length_1911_cov_70.657358_g717_i0~~NODE_775_length_1911_cov_70.657358_g717_i0.p1  ORF type:complete len:580 (+),score=83.18 NODE_775_length_1911_cov_70.657358_g717_i0:100-1839(+)